MHGGQPVDQAHVTKSYGIAIGFSLVSLVLALIQSFKRKPAPALILAYAGTQGVALGYTQAFSSFGGLLVAIANSYAIQIADSLPAIAVPGFAASWWGKAIVRA